MTEQEKAIIIEELWLIYFNDTLRSRGLITEEQWVKMHTKINLRTEMKKKRIAGGKNERN